MRTGLAALLLASATAFAPGRGGRATRSPAFRASRAAPSFAVRAAPVQPLVVLPDDLHASLRERWCELMLGKMVIAHSLPELELALVDGGADELDSVSSCDGGIALQQRSSEAISARLRGARSTRAVPRHCRSSCLMTSTWSCTVADSTFTK